MCEKGLTKEASGGILGCLLVSFLIFTILFIIAFQIVPPTEVGIDFDGTARTYDNQRVYRGGRYFLGVGHSFITYPITYQLIDFSSEEPAGGDQLTILSKGGQTVYVDISFYYRIDETHVQEIYASARNNLRALLIREAQDSLRTTASLFSVQEYIKFRKEIAQRMQEDINKVFYSKYYCWVPLFQLRYVGLPSTVENSLVQLAVSSQNTNTSELARNITLINQETQILSQQIEANITVVTQQANSEGATLEANANANGSREVVETEAAAQNNFTTTLGFNPQHLVTYNFVKMLKTASSSESYVIGFKGTVPIILG